MRIRFPFFFTRMNIGWDFLLLVFFLGYDRLTKPLSLAIWVLVVLISVLIHELGHAVIFRVFGYKSLIRLYYFGGLTIPNIEKNLRRAIRDLLIKLDNEKVGIGVIRKKIKRHYSVVVKLRKGLMTLDTLNELKVILSW